METIKILSGKNGWVLRVNGVYIDIFNKRSIKTKFNAIPYNATQWLSIKDLHKYWNDYMPLIINYSYKPINN